MSESLATPLRPLLIGKELEFELWSIGMKLCCPSLLGAGGESGQRVKTDSTSCDMVRVGKLSMPLLRT